MAKKIDILQHLLVPKHAKLSEEDAKKLLESYNITTSQLPKILKSDPAIKHLNPKVGDIIKITRESPTAGKTEFYRIVING